MVIRSQWLQASGYLFIFLMPALFVVGAMQQRTWLAFGVVVMVFPLARLVFGALPSRGVPEWREGVATALDKLPLAYPAVLVLTVLAGLHATATQIGTDTMDWLGFGLSLWMTFLFATCVAHELFHRRSKTEARLGHLLAGFVGYPLLGIEHIAHHGRPGDTDRAEVPLMAESMWAFAGRRLRRVGIEFLGRQSPLFHLGIRRPGASQARAAALVTLATALAFWALGGWAALLVYLGMMVGVAFGIQLITYIQHWGLGAKDVGNRVEFGRGWEEDCQFQAWITLSISLHDKHHRDSHLPYYRLDLSPDSPRLPASYVLLMFACMAPGFWRRIMAAAHARWLAQPGNPQSSGRRLTCFGLGST